MCETKFIGRRKKYCSDACMIVAHRRGKLVTARAWREMPASVISLREIWERDGKRCHICGEHVVLRDVSRDHLIPVSAGGPNTRENLALAHRVCNSRRGPGRLPAQLRLVG